MLSNWGLCVVITVPFSGQKSREILRFKLLIETTDIFNFAIILPSYACRMPGYMVFYRIFSRIRSFIHPCYLNVNGKQKDSGGKLNRQQRICVRNSVL